MMDRLISEREAIDEIYSYKVNPDQVISEHPDDVFQYNSGLISAIQAIKSLPTAQPQHIKGQWIHDGYDHPHGVDWIHCSVCGRYRTNVPADLTNFCPFCGADMRDDINRIVKDLLHVAIDKGVWAEDAYPNIKERLHKVVDEYEVKEE